ncbi:AhpC/TSA antioxidant enzyme-domain-containing protein [Favolaschia claudopus]|uniref:AhpC/TSA antioxidant enzyme-domain-containing protein n=1 Tax=Favolaschia claudopus TaxID=2862362 RepID=A0AAW0C417_9AGAR
MSLRDSLPDTPSLERASACEIQDENGNKVTFGSIIENKKTVVVFIRHFFCGVVEQLAAIPQTALDAAETKIVVIGCGDYRALPQYKENANYSGSIYADSNRELYFALGMDIETTARTPAGEEKRSYVTQGFYTNLWNSMKRGPFRDPSLIGKQGNFNQLGGDFIFGPGNTCTWAHRMQHTQDHMEVADLMKAAGVSLP